MRETQNQIAANASYIFAHTSSVCSRASRHEFVHSPGNLRKGTTFGKMPKAARKMRALPGFSPSTIA
jgi:hypothetical protein